MENYTIEERGGSRWQVANAGYELYREGKEGYAVTSVRLRDGDTPWLCRKQEEEEEFTDDGETL